MKKLLDRLIGLSWEAYNKFVEHWFTAIMLAAIALVIWVYLIKTV